MSRLPPRRARSRTPRCSPLAGVTLDERSGVPIYDAYVLNAVKLASPFDPIPKALIGNEAAAAFHLWFTYQSSQTLPVR